MRGMSSRSSDKGGDPSVFAAQVKGTENGNSANNRSHYPFSRCYRDVESINSNPSSHAEESNKNMASSPMRLVPSRTQDFDESESNTLVTVQARYRLHSPTLNNSRAGDKLLSTSPPYAFSGGSSFHGDMAPSRFPAGLSSSVPIPVKAESSVGSVGSRSAQPFTGSYAPSGFSMPPALTERMSPSINDTLLLSPHQRACGTPQGLGSQHSLLRGTEFTSPMSYPMSPPYHNNDLTSIHSPPTVRGGIGGMRKHATAAAERSQGRQGKYHSGASEEASTVSGSSASSIQENLPLCPNDDMCTLINNRKHQRKYTHTCRLYPCYHSHVARHGKLFRHTPGQIAQTNALTTCEGPVKKLPAEALASVNFSSISQDAPNAYRVIVSHGDQSYEIFGDWKNVRVHTFKRYLHQVYKIPPTSQVLVRKDGGIPLDDDIKSVHHYGVKQDTVITLRHKEDDAPPRVPIEDL